jgi:hypothetical protein
MKLLGTFVVFALIAISTNAQNQPVLVELFTYDGCSNCATSARNFKDLIPPGDSLLTNRAVLITYHVDYDSQDDFLDPFNDKRWQDRQKQYARFGISDGIYTPQVVINGKSAFSGSNRARLFREINLADSISIHPQYQVKVAFDSIGRLVATAQIETEKEDLIFNFVLVKNRKLSNPSTGENAGRTMESRNIAVDFMSLLPKSQLKYVYDFKDITSFSEYHLVSFFQRMEDGQVLSLKETYFYNMQK